MKGGWGTTHPKRGHFKQSTKGRVGPLYDRKFKILGCQSSRIPGKKEGKGTRREGRRTAKGEVNKVNIKNGVQRQDVTS